MLGQLDHGYSSGFDNPAVDLTPLKFSTLYMHMYSKYFVLCLVLIN